jgi:hypothetical protein
MASRVARTDLLLKRRDPMREVRRSVRLIPIKLAQAMHLQASPKPLVLLSPAIHTVASERHTSLRTPQTLPCR